MKPYRLTASILSVCVLTACIPVPSSTGNPSPRYPFFVTTQAMVVKNISVPKGTRLEYEQHWYKRGEQSEPMNINGLNSILWPPGEPMQWGGIPVRMIYKFANPDMRGYSVMADFLHTQVPNPSSFYKLWKSCSNTLGISVKNADDWSFNQANISDITSCSINYARPHEGQSEKAKSFLSEQQMFLNELLAEMRKIKE